MESRYSNPLSRHWGIHHQKEHHPSDSDDDESAGPVGDEELSSVASSQTSGTCPSGHGMETPSKSRKRERESQGQRKTAKTAEETEGTSRLFKYTTSGRIGAGRIGAENACLVDAVDFLLPDKLITEEFRAELYNALPKWRDPIVKDIQGVLASQVGVVAFQYY